MHFYCWIKIQVPSIIRFSLQTDNNIWQQRDISPLTTSWTPLLSLLLTPEIAEGCRADLLISSWLIVWREPCFHFLMNVFQGFEGPKQKEYRNGPKMHRGMFDRPHHLFIFMSSQSQNSSRKVLVQAYWNCYWFCPSKLKRLFQETHTLLICWSIVIFMQVN